MSAHFKRAENAELPHDENIRNAQEEDRVDVVLPGRVTQYNCCQFVGELLKFILYQRQQLPMTYDEMVSLHEQRYTSTQPEDAVLRRKSGDFNWLRFQKTLQELDEVLTNLETLFCLSHVPRVLIMLGGSTVLPTELYEINMEALELGGCYSDLSTSSCLRRLFHALFVADLLSDVKAVRLMATTVMALGHRDCGVEWFKPKVDFQVSTRVKKKVISLASDSKKIQSKNLEDYIWFQTPVTIKGFCK